ncbi:MAG: UbiA family prenyltransferase, partial [Dehalococcoidia bacterium]
LERDIDALMSRTRDRALPAGRLDPAVALWFAVALGLVGTPLLTFAVKGQTTEGNTESGRTMISRRHSFGS